MASSNQQKTDAEKKLVGDIVKTDLYALLEVDTDATDKELLKAYRYVALFNFFGFLMPSMFMSSLIS